MAKKRRSKKKTRHTNKIGGKKWGGAMGGGMSKHYMASEGGPKHPKLKRKMKRMHDMEMEKEQKIKEKRRGKFYSSVGELMAKFGYNN